MTTSHRRLLGYAAYRLPIAAILLLFYVPLVAIFVFSFWEPSGLWMEPAFQLTAYDELLTSLQGQLLHSLEIGLLSGLVSLVLAFPIAYLVTFVVTDFQRKVLLGVFAIPFFVSPLIRTVMLIPVLGQNGLVNDVLLGLGVVREPVGFLLFSDLGVLVGTVTTFMPFIVFTGWLSMSMIDRELINAAADLRARPLTVVRTVIVPLALPGLSVGVLFVIASSMGESVYPLVLGGTNAVSIGVMTERAFSHLNVPLVSAIMVVSISAYVLGLLVVTRFLDLADLFETFE